MVEQDAMLRASARDLGQAMAAGQARAELMTAPSMIALEGLPVILGQVQRALERAGLEETVGLVSQLDIESGVKATGAYPDGCAQHEALWALVMAAKAAQAPLEAGRYLENAAKCAALALEAPIAEPTQTGIKSAQETVRDDGTIGLMLSGYASRFGEMDLHGEVMHKGAFRGIKSEWGAAERPPVLLNHGFDDVIGFRPIGECTRYDVDDVGLKVDVWVPREPDPKRFSGAALRRFKDTYASIAAGKTAGLSIGGTYSATGPGIKRWNTQEISVTDRPCLPSATFVVRH